MNQSVSIAIAGGTASRAKWQLLGALAVAGSLVSGLWLVASQHPLHTAEIALSSGEFRDALKLAEIELKKDPNSPQALLIAGYAAQGLRRPEIALRYFSCVPDDGTANTILALVPLADYALKSARALDAERALQRVLELDPDHAQARDRLIYLLVLEGRIWEAQQQILRVLQSGRTDVNHLTVMSSNRTELGDSDGFADSCLAAVPDDPLPLIPKARRAYRNQEVQQARKLLERIVASRPEILEAQALLGILLAETDDLQAFAEWHDRLPRHADDHPGIWFGRGLWAMKSNQRESSIRCFAETLNRQPNHIAASYQLSQSLAAVGQQSLATEFGNRSRDLSRLEFLISESQIAWTEDGAGQIVQRLQSLGRAWEAAAWCHVVLDHNRDDSWAVQKLRQLRPILNQNRSQVIDSANLVFRVDLVKYPLPSWQRAAKSLTSTETNDSHTNRVTFTDEAARLGLQFTYQNGATKDNRESMFEFGGGGVAVLDYDADGWPDVYLTQGGLLPPEVGPRSTGDCLFRNIAADQAVDVTLAAGLGDTAYSQGVAVGDFNNDGFPDLYVANIGPNTFYRNNGDGTFVEISKSAGTAGDDWTSSCVLTDVNGDGLPDLYAVNYLTGDELRTRQCLKTSQQRCHPSLFRAAPDRLYLNLGDGRFEDVTSQGGIVDDDGRGLGIIAADLDGSRRISLFVGNDMSRNLYFVNQTPYRGAFPRFAEMALLRGVAVDSRGIPKAAMGIAAGDANGDGLLDLFVTNFYRESNNLYLQQPDHSFRDATREANLSEPGFYMLGWGTQFIDGELDGLPDLIVANGHVHNPSDSAVPYRMLPQYFRNTGKCRFEELQAATLGEFFQIPNLGRSLARLDWNRDGLEDICISHLDTPAGLLLNRTPDHGHFLTVRLVGTDCDRDAIGTTIDVVVQGQRWRSPLTAGDGYQASNQRQLVFGLGHVSKIERIEVRWPTGRIQIFANLPVDREFIVVEGRSAAVEINR